MKDRTEALDRISFEETGTLAAEETFLSTFVLEVDFFSPFFSDLPIVKSEGGRDVGWEGEKIILSFSIFFSLNLGRSLNSFRAGYSITCLGPNCRPAHFSESLIVDMDDSTFDVVVLGTGLTESIVAA